MSRQDAHPGTPQGARALPPFDGKVPYFPYGKPEQSAAVALRPCSASPRSILLAWELGAGLGHLMQMLPLAEDLIVSTTRRRRCGPAGG